MRLRRAVTEDEVTAARRVDDLERRRIPLISDVYALLMMFESVVTLTLFIALLMNAVERATSGRASANPMHLTFILSSIRIVALMPNIICLAAFGIFLLRGRRRHAARWSYVLMPLVIMEGLLSLALDGLGINLLSSLIQLSVLVAVSITLDPALLEERRREYIARRSKNRSDYEHALALDMVGRDKSGKGYIALDFFNIFWLFVIGSVFGLVIETIYHFIATGEYQNRAGLLWGPFSPIYGCGAVILTVCLNRLWRANWPLIFFASAVIGGAFEFSVSWFLEVAFGITSWDYTGQWLSIGGRTSGRYMLFWGLLGLLWVKVLLPRLLWLINLIPWKVRYSLTAMFLVFVMINATATLMAMDCWYGRTAGLPQDSPVTRFFGRHFGDEYMRLRFPSMTIDPSKAGRQ